MADFSHLNNKSEGQMVDVTAKDETQRLACVDGKVTLSHHIDITNDAIEEIIRTARIAGVMAAKRTADLIPYCHQLNLRKVEVSISFNETSFAIRSVAKLTGQTGVEMEALVAAQIAATTIYDMIKAVDPSAKLGPFALMEKRGGKTGLWQNPVYGRTKT